MVGVLGHEDWWGSWVGQSGIFREADLHLASSQAQAGVKAWGTGTLTQLGAPGWTQGCGQTDTGCEGWAWGGTGQGVVLNGSPGSEDKVTWGRGSFTESAAG